MNASVVVMFAQIAVSLVLVLWTRYTVKKILGSGDELQRIRSEIGALVVELDASADRNVSIIEDRLSTLKNLIAEADKRIAILSSDSARRLRETGTYDRSGRTPAQRGQTEPPQESTTPVTAGQENTELPFVRFSEKPLPVEEPFADKVISLARRGFSSDIIAARLGATMAEVDLVLSLERERGGGTREP
ncbi:MAG: hypothetical protein JXM71_01995 [Spirochaetales bacterium]|nr:hypothetical protein [Spirochaetales bacterium]